jgi:acyl-CoA dehydrogenase
MQTQGTDVAADSVPAGSLRELKARAEAVAAVAATFTNEVDRDARFPAEAFAEARRQRLLGMMVPRELGGEGSSISNIVDVCYVLGQACASTGMIFAMHQVKMGCLVRHRSGSPAMDAVLRRVAGEQLLLASSTTEGQGGGNVRSSEAPVERNGDQISLERKATVISYGAVADGIVTTARRAPDAVASDQVLLVFFKSQYTLEPMQGWSWNTLGMRGTCSDGFTLRATGTADNIVPVPYETIHAQTMVPCAHLMWGAVWAGIAAAATTRAQSFIRHASRQSNGQIPPGARHFTSGVTSLRLLRSLLASSLRSYEQALAGEKALNSLDFQSMITLTKVEASELAATTVLHAMRACGLAGYRNDGEFSIGRHLRDVLSSPIMINNDRILANIAASSLLTPLPASISG